MDFQAVLKSTITLFAIVNPVGSIPLFIQVTAGMSDSEKKRAFRIAVLASAVILFAFALVGDRVLAEFFRIEFADLMAAGGLLLLIIAVDHLVFGSMAKSVSCTPAQDRECVGAVPVACPMLAGPGAMMAVLLTYAEHGLGVASVSIVIVISITWLILRFVDRIYGLLGKMTCLVLSKILCLFLAAIGMNLLMQGISHYLR